MIMQDMYISKIVNNIKMVDTPLLEELQKTIAEELFRRSNETIIKTAIK